MTRSRANPLPTPPVGLYKLHLRDLKNYFLGERLSFILICLYSFFEYVRPQAIYASLKGLPLTSGTVLLTIICLFLEGPRNRKMTSLDWFLAAFTVIMLVASVTAVDPSISYKFLRPYYIEWLVVILLTAAIVNTESRFFVFMLLWIMWSLKMSQHGTREWADRGFSFAGWGISCAPQFFQNSGECGIQMAMFFPISLYFYLGIRAYLTRKRKWLIAAIPGTAAVTIMASSSRGAQLALAAVLLWIVLRSKNRIKSLVYTAVAAAMLYAILPAEQMERFNTMGTDETSTNRKEYWKDGILIMSQYPLLGLGPDNWLAYYRTNYNPKGEVQHNIFIQAGTELGYTGLAIFVAMIVCTFTLNHKTRKIANSISNDRNFYWCMAHGFDGALVGYIVSGSFVTVLFYPFFWTNVAMTLALHNVAFKAAKRHRMEQGVPAGAAQPDRGRMRGGVRVTRPGPGINPIPPWGAGGHAS